MTSPDEGSPGTVLHGPGTRVELRYATPYHAKIHVTTPRDDVTGPAGTLLCRAVSQARAHGTSVVTTAVDASGPAGGALIGALRSRVGADVAGLTMRRAGSSVMVTMDLVPPQRPCSPTRRAAVRHSARTLRRS